MEKKRQGLLFLGHEGEGINICSETYCLGWKNKKDEKSMRRWTPVSRKKSGGTPGRDWQKDFLN